MRITGGILRGRRIPEAPKRVRPTQDRVREAIFSSLAPILAGARVLDLFAGVGTLGLEAWSRGAASVCWVERDAAVCRALQSNVKALCDDSDRPVRVVRADAFRFLAASPEPETYDVILVDPPYASRVEESPLPRLSEIICDKAAIAPEGILVFEQSAQLDSVEVSGWTLLKDRRYGEARILMYRR